MSNTIYTYYIGIIYRIFHFRQVPTAVHHGYTIPTECHDGKELIHGNLSKIRCHLGAFFFYLPRR